MRIDTLDLLAWGPFTETRLSLAGGQFGLHLVYGANEAGKSTALRGLLALLFGVTARAVQDDHRHARNDLRVAAEVCDREGRRSRVIRRVGDPKKSLRDAADKQVVEPFWLEAGEADDDEFRSRFVFGYDDFVAGGRTMLSGGGEVGQTLFAAAAGLGDLSAVRQALAADWEELYKPKGRNPRLNEALAGFSDARSRLAKLSLKESEYVALRDQRERAQQARQQAEERLAQLDRRRRELESRVQALPELTLRDELVAQLVSLAAVPLLAEDFDKKRLAAARDLAVKQQAKARAEKQRDDLARQLADLPPPDSLLTHAGAVGALLRKSGEITKAQADLPRLRAEHREKDQALREQLAELPAGAAEIRIARDDRQQLRTLHDERNRITHALELRTRQHETELAEIRDCSTALAGLPVSPPPVATISLARQARSAADRAAALTALEARLNVESSRLARLIPPLGLSPAAAASLTANTLPAGAAPAIETLEEERDRQARLASQLTQAEDRAAELARELAGVTAELARREADEQPPTWDEVAAARRRRDEAWRLLRELLAGQQPLPLEQEAVLRGAGDAADLPAALEFWQARADQAVDRLCREAQAAERHAAARGQRDKLAAQQAVAQSQIAAHAAALAAVQTAWADLWRPLGVAARSPREMLAWRRQLGEAQELARNVADLSHQRDQAAEQLAQLHGRLTAALSELPQGAGAAPAAGLPVAELGELFVAQIESWSAAAARRVDQAGQLASLEKKAAESEREQARLTARESAIAQQWQTLVQPLPPALQAEPRALFRVLDALDDIAARKHELLQIQQRIEGMQRDQQKFASDVQQLAAAAAPDLPAAEPALQIDTLDGRLRAAQEQAARRSDLGQRLAKAEEEYDRESAAAAALEALLAQLCREAHCATPDELDRRVLDAQLKRQAERDLAAVQERLRRLAGSRALDDFARTARELSEDELHAELTRLRAELEIETSARDAALQAFTTADTDLRRLDGAGAAAEVEEEAQSQLARIRSLSEQFIRLRLAGRVLDDAIARHQRENETPILRRAGQLFSRLTLGSFSDLRTSYTENGDSVLVGVREDAKEVGVEGMSDGARDQLFLALRLASLELFLSGREPIPFVVDDILINFDDARAGAALQVLAELARQTQVILFTHHQHLADLAQKKLPPSELFVHSLP